MHDSVPPLVMVPTVSGPPLCSSIAAVARSFSIAEMLGNAVGSSPLRPHAVAAASVAMRRTSGSPESKW
ncbi:MAG: hypothetical protein U0R64_00115 [Candidatus Nanopelagicales bacterium]